MKWLWDTGGYRLTLLARAAMVALTVLFVALASLQLAHRGRRDSDPTRYMSVVLAMAVFAFFAFPHLSFRPATAAILLMAVCAWLFLRDRAVAERSKAVWLVIPITALMINLHLSAIVIPMWVGALFAGALIEYRSARDPRSIRRYAILLISSALACLATPLLPGVIAAAWHYQARDVMVASHLITEMAPIWSGIGGAITMGLVALLFLAAWKGRRQLRIGEWLWLIVGLVLMLRLGRFAPIFALIAAPVLGATIPRMSDKPLVRGPIQIVIALALLSFVVRVAARFPARDLSLCDWLNRDYLLFRYPCVAADWVEANISPRLDSRSGRLINEFNWGGYLEWRLGPQFQTLLDGRTQLFTADFWNHTLLAPDEATLAAFLNDQHADAAILPTGKSRFRSALQQLGWTSAHKDEVGEVWLPPSKAPSSAPATSQESADRKPEH
jgi:hypothetical protein